MGQHVVSVQGVSKVYSQDTVPFVAVKNVSFDVTQGDFMALVGPSGSGKTTRLNMIGALDTPTEGTIAIAGEPLQDKSKRELSLIRRDLIGFVFQSFNLIPVLSARENVELTLSLQKVPKSEKKERAFKALEEVGLKGMEDRRPFQLSGGQQQRVAIARAIAPRPHMILADEPTANLDSKTAVAILDLMKRLSEERGVTFLFSTHDHRIVKAVKRLIRMQDGEIEHDTKLPTQE